MLKHEEMEQTGMIIQFILGWAHATIFGIFLIAAAGKMAVCRPGMGVMCVKGSLDALLALSACLLVIPGIAQVTAVLAIAVAAGGWGRERMTRNSVCNCFGVLTSVLHPWRNASRAVLLTSGLLVLALQSLHPPIDVLLWIGFATGLATLLAFSSLAFARSPLVRPASAVASQAMPQVVAGTIAPSVIVGSDINGRKIALGELGTSGAQRALLITSPGCTAYQKLKAQIEPLLPHFPLPVFHVVEAETINGALELSDPHGQWRKSLGVRVLPSLAIINAGCTGLDYPVAMGEAEILALLLRLALTPPGAHHAVEEELASDTSLIMALP